MIGGVLFAIGMFGLAIATLVALVLAIAGRRDPARPRCAACRTLLEASQIIEHGRCNVCAVDLRASRALQPRWRPAGRAIWLAVAALALLWPAGIVTARFLTHRAMGAARLMTPGQNAKALMTTALRSPSSSFAAVQSLEMAIGNGTLTIHAARELMLAEMRRGPRPAPPTDGTIGDGAPDRSGTLLVANRILAHRPDDHELLDALLDFLEPPPEPRCEPQTPPRRSDAGGLLLHLGDSTPRMSGAADDTMIVTMLLLRRLRIDGAALPIQPLHRSSACETFALGDPHTPLTLPPLSPGAHRIELDFDAVVLEGFDAKRLFQMGGCIPIGGTAPTPLRSASRRVVMTIDERGREIPGPSAPGASPPASAPDSP